MEEQLLEQLQFPVGRYNSQEVITAEKKEAYLQAIAQAPQAVRLAVDGLTDEQLDTPYRPGGWTIRWSTICPTAICLLSVCHPLSIFYWCLYFLLDLHDFLVPAT